MHAIQAILYVITAVLLVLCALGWIPRIQGGFLAAACFVIAFGWPILATL